MDFLPGNNADEWQFLGSSTNIVPYQRVTLNQHMKWSTFSLECFVGSCSKFSGAIALMWNTDEPLPLSSDVSLSTDIFIFDSCGKMLAQIPGSDWQHTKIVVMGWTLSERLFILLEDGVLITVTKLFEQAFVDLVSHAIGTENGCIAYTRTGRVLVIGCDAETPIISEYKRFELQSGNAVTAMACIEGRCTESGDPLVLIACWDQQMVAVTKDTITNLHTEDKFFGRIQRMSVSPDQHFIACHTSEGWVVVLNSAFDKKLLEFNTHAKSIPRDLIWCGCDSVVGYWRNCGLILISPFCDYLRFDYDPTEEPLFLVSEIDSIRVYSKNRHELIRAVPPSLFNLYMEGSQSPGYILRNAFSRFTQSSGDEEAPSGTGRLTDDELVEGVQECLEAAEEEFSTLLQEELLRSANYGENCIEDPLQHEFVATSFPRLSRILRIQNALRCETVGLYLTKSQYDLLGEKAVLSRLLSRHLYYLAVKICQFAGIPHDFVLVDWACQKVKSAADITDEALCSLIRSRLQAHTSLKYTQIAWSAHQAGRPDLACRFLQFEPSIADRLPSLLLMEQYEIALEEAMRSRDEDLILFTALHIYLKYHTGGMKRTEFVELIKKYPDPMNSLREYLHVQNQQEYEDLLKSQGNLDELCAITYQKAFSHCSFEDRIALVKELNSMVTQLLPTRKDLDFLSKVLADHLKLLGFQKEISGQVKEGCCTELSVDELIGFCIQNSQLKQADRIRSVFKIPDKKFWYLKIRALAKAGFWDVLKAFGFDKKSPIGYQPFVEICLKYENVEQARLYLPKMSDTKERLKWSLECGAFELAVVDATKLKDIEALKEICQKCEDDLVRDTAQRTYDSLMNAQ